MFCQAARRMVSVPSCGTAASRTPTVLGRLGVAGSLTPRLLPPITSSRSFFPICSGPPRRYRILAPPRLFWSLAPPKPYPRLLIHPIKTNNLGLDRHAAEERVCISVCVCVCAFLLCICDYPLLQCVCVYASVCLCLSALERCDYLRLFMCILTSAAFLI